MTTHDEGETLAASLLERLAAAEAELAQLRRPVSEEVALIEAQAEATTAIIEAEAEAFVTRTEAETEAVTEIAETEGADENSSDSGGSSGLAPAPDHWLFRPLGKRK